MTNKATRLKALQLIERPNGGHSSCTHSIIKTIFDNRNIKKNRSSFEIHSYISKFTINGFINVEILMQQKKDET